ncbi:hypothetical protein AHMF7605_11625 [Adhaeribacter arboris]|uniref:Peptidase M15C domain-containing protein n=1 Tax=Adhaeribacter arboris TaxID=2072846 RepID=A0A2T2YF26_9BACT|nr:M15 family metallopeptidase [Adhaeribacter arboris]PSR54121.1 hypothetical protein AHMF7605_11625 [Adhaeribacter arboris]
MTLREKQSLFLKNFALLILWAFEQGYEVTAGELLRTDQQHAWNIAHGKSKADRSKHQDKLAGDLNLFIGGKYVTDSTAHAPLGKYWKSLHPQNRWGGDFKGFVDGNHYEML